MTVASWRESLSETSRCRWVVALREVLKRNPGPADATWKETVRPWLEDYWPKEKALNTAQSSTALVGVIMETGDAFPDAVVWANTLRRR